MPGSALVGEPPATPNDLLIVRGALLSAGLVGVDPSKGLHLPPFRPPPSEYHFQTRAPAVIAVCSVCIVLMFTATVARLMVRRLKNDVKLGLDDWLIIPALIIGLLWPALNIGTAKLGGGGKHLYDVTYQELAYSNWFGTFAKVDFFVAVGFVKLSITSFNMRLTGLSSKRWMYAHWAFFGVLVIYILTSILLITFQCNPVVAGWDSVATGRLETPPKCLSELAVGNPLSIWHVVMDFCLLAVPILVLWKIKIPFNVKFRLLGLFSIGAVCCFCSVMRQVAQSRLKFDPTYNYTGIVYWSLADMTISIIVASLPILSTVVPGCVPASHKASKPSGYSSSLSISKPRKPPQAFDTHSKHSREGIMRQDEVELQFQNRDPADLENGNRDVGDKDNDPYHFEERSVPWTGSGH